MDKIHQLEKEINHMAAKMISEKLGSDARKGVTVSPFKLEPSKQKGKGLGGYINQSTQSRDFDSWVSPGNFVLHILNTPQ